MRQSMTGFASQAGQGFGFEWLWEIRSVNGKGLDLRCRLPDWLAGLEAELRRMVQGRLARGNLQIALRISASGPDGAMRLDPDMLSGILSALCEIESKAQAQGLSLAPMNAAQIASLRGVLTSENQSIDPATITPLVWTDFETALQSFCAMRASEGEALAQVLDGQLAEIERLTLAAKDCATKRAPRMNERLRAALERIMQNADGLDDARLTQEMALLAMRADVTEEIDRLLAHVSAARDLLKTKGAVGRKLDFLMQEFNREANTLCSKSNDTDLTQIGLALKTVIDQMREQVQNVE